MYGYVNTLIAVILIAEIAVCLSPDGADMKKYVRLVAALAVLLTMLSPIRTLVASIPRIAEKAEEFFAETEAVQPPDGLGEAAAVLVDYLEENYGKKAAHSTVTFVTDEKETVTEVQFFLPECDSEDGERIKAVLGRELKVKVTVFFGRITEEK